MSLLTFQFALQLNGLPYKSNEQGKDSQQLSFLLFMSSALLLLYILPDFYCSVSFGKFLPSQPMNMAGFFCFPSENVTVLNTAVISSTHSGHESIHGNLIYLLWLK